MSKDQTETTIELAPLDHRTVAVFFRLGGKIIASGEVSTIALKQAIAEAEAPTAVEEVLRRTRDLIRDAVRKAADDVERN